MPLAIVIVELCRPIVTTQKHQRMNFELQVNCMMFLGGRWLGTQRCKLDIINVPYPNAVTSRLEETVFVL